MKSTEKEQNFSFPATKHKLVIAEKPSVARSIAGVIGANKKQDGYMEGNGYLVSWCIGHLVSLADAGTYDERFKKWRYDDLPILPQEWQYIIPDDKKKQFDTLRSVSNCRETKRRPQHCGRDRREQETGRLHGGERLSGELVYRAPCFPCRRRDL